MIFFFDVKGLIEELKVKRPRSKENFQYVAAFIVYRSIENLIVMGAHSDAPKGVAGYIGAFAGSVIGVVLICALLFSLYQANGGQEGDYFLDRFLALGWVATMRVSIIVLPVLVGFQLLPDVKTEDGFGMLGMSVVGILAVLLGVAIYWFMLVKKSLLTIRESSRVTAAI